MYNSEKLNAFPLNSGTRYVCQCSLLQFNTELKVLVNKTMVGKKEKEKWEKEGGRENELVRGIWI